MIEWRDVALVAGPGLAYLAAWGTTRQSDRASERTKKAQDDATAVDRDRLGLDALETSLSEQEKRITRLRTDLDSEQKKRESAERRAVRAEEKIDRVAVSLAAHGQWDLLVLAEVRKTTADFPEPPPLTLTD